MLVSGSDDTLIHLYDTSNGVLKYSLSGHQSWVLSVKVSPNDKYIASSSNDKNVKIWDLKTGNFLNNLKGEHTEAIWAVAWNNIGSKLFSVGDDSKLVIYNSLDN